MNVISTAKRIFQVRKNVSGVDMNPSHADEDYYFAEVFEVAVEVINTVAGIIILLACALAGLNLILVAINSMAGTHYNMIDPMHAQDKATLLRTRQVLGEQTALALGILVAADVLDTVLKPAHAYDLQDVLKMGFVTLLRTGLAYFLSIEIKEIIHDHETKAIHSMVHSRSQMNLKPSSDDEEGIQPGVYPPEDLQSRLDRSTSKNKIATSLRGNGNFRFRKS